MDISKGPAFGNYNVVRMTLKDHFMFFLEFSEFSELKRKNKPT
jgi:hypothetical protein